MVKVKGLSEAVPSPGHHSVWNVEHLSTHHTIGSIWLVEHDLQGPVEDPATVPTLGYDASRVTGYRRADT